MLARGVNFAEVVTISVTVICDEKRGLTEQRSRLQTFPKWLNSKTERHDCLVTAKKDARGRNKIWSHSNVYEACGTSKGKDWKKTVASRNVERG